MLSDHASQTLAYLRNAGGNPVYLTSEQGKELAENGLIQVNPGETDPNNPAAYRVNLTDQGTALNQQAPPAPAAAPQAEWSAPAPPQAQTPGAQYMTTEQQGQAPAAPAQPPAAKPKAEDFQIQDGIEIPKISGRGGGGASNLKPRESVYPFDKLNVGQSFHVPATAENPEPHKKMASNVSAANKRSEIEVVPQVMVDVERRKLRKDVSGNAVKDEQGKKIYDKTTEQEPKKVQTKKFLARRVNESDPNGPGVRVFRVPLDNEDQQLVDQTEQAKASGQQQAPPQPAGPPAPPQA